MGELSHPPPGPQKETATKQRIGSILLALALCLSLLPTAAFADDESATETAAWINSTPYTTFDDACNDARDGDTIKLQADTGFTKSDAILQKSLIIDLNTHTFDNPNKWTFPKSTVVFQNRTIGRLWVEDDHADVTLSNITVSHNRLMLKNGAALTLKNANVTRTLKVEENNSSTYPKSQLSVQGTSHIKLLNLLPANAQVTLSAGTTFDEIDPAIDGQSLADMLAEGCAFQDKTAISSN